MEPGLVASRSFPSTRKSIGASMRMATHFRIAFVTAAALAISGMTTPAQAESEFEAPLVACLSNGTSIGGVGSCGKIWKLKSGKAELKANGKLEVEVKGL